VEVERNSLVDCRRWTSFSGLIQAGVDDFEGYDAMLELHTLPD